MTNNGTVVTNGCLPKQTGNVIVPENSRTGKSIHVQRPHYQQEDVNSIVGYEKPKINLSTSVKSYCRSVNPLKFILDSFPVIQWLSKYNLKQFLVGDLIAGITVAVMHIPQGMGYAMLGNVSPITGIYMAFFPVLVYFIFGTSKHISMGTFALVCLMTGKLVSKHSAVDVDHTFVFQNNITSSTEPVYSPVEVATAVCFMVGVIQLIMYVLRLGILCSLLSDTLVSGFTTAAAFHVLGSQLKNLIGVTLLPSKSAYFEIIHTFSGIVLNLSNTNIASLVISCITISVICMNNAIFKPLIGKLCIVPVPIELIAIVTGTLVSYYLNLHEVYNVPIIGSIPTGFPEPQVPTISLLSSVALDSIPIAIVAFTVSMSMALIFAQKLDYKVDPNQELLAHGAGNIVGSFFPCMPYSASISRSLIQQDVGGQTQLASVVSCGVLAVVLLYIGPFFEPLPKCVLASVISVALKGSLMQITHVVKYARLNIYDGIVWIATFLTVIIFSVDIGLFVGLVFSLSSIIIQGTFPLCCLLGNMPNTDLYLDARRYKGTINIPGIKIFRYSGGLNFASRDHFRSELNRLTNFDLKKKLQKDITNMDRKNSVQDELPLNCVVLDFSAVSYIDPSGVASLRSLAKEFSTLNIKLYLAGCSCSVYETLRKCDNYENIPTYINIFPTIHDAVYAATAT